MKNCGIQHRLHSQYSTYSCNEFQLCRVILHSFRHSVSWMQSKPDVCLSSIYVMHGPCLFLCPIYVCPICLLHRPIDFVVVDGKQEFKSNEYLCKASVKHSVLVQSNKTSVVHSPNALRRATENGWLETVVIRPTKVRVSKWTQQQC